MTIASTESFRGGDFLCDFSNIEDPILTVVADPVVNYQLLAVTSDYVSEGGGCMIAKDGMVPVGVLKCDTVYNKVL